MGRLQQKKSDQEKREKRKKIQEEKTETDTRQVKKSYVPAKTEKHSKEINKNSFFHRSVEFVKEAKGELKRVVWPGRKQTVASTIMVIVFVAILSSFLGLADFILSGLMALVLRS